MGELLGAIFTELFMRDAERRGPPYIRVLAWGFAALCAVATAVGVVALVVVLA